MSAMFGPFDRPRLLVLGAGESGLAIARFAHAHGAHVRLADTRTDAALRDRARAVVPDIEVTLGGFDVALLDATDLVGISPGLSPFHAPTRAFVEAAGTRHVPVWGEIEFFAQALAHLKATRGYAPRLVGITGTNGKTTVTSMVGFLANHAGVSARVAGNISPAALDALGDALAHDTLPALWALELSSFQLEFTHTLALDASIVLNVTEDHLDWHPSMAEYAQAKGRIHAHARARFANRADAVTIEIAGEGAHTIGLDTPTHPGDWGVEVASGLRWLARCEGEAPAPKKRRKPGASPDAANDDIASDARLVRLMPADALPLIGDHNVFNALAALALVHAAGVPIAQALHAMRSFVGLAHRVEFVRAVRGVDYIDDSKGTNVGATVAALDGLKRRVVLIAGGDGKGQDFAPLARPLQTWARAAVLIGRDAARIASIVPAEVPHEHAETLESAVQRAAALAHEGDAVLLSPACASLDMFRNYKHRAEVFVDAVRALALDAGEFA